MLKTPTAQLAVNGGSQHPDKRTAGGHGPTLADQVEHLLPTPRVAAGGENPESWLERNEKLARERPKGASGIPLETAMLLLPTPAVADGDGGRTSRSGNRLGEKLLGGIVKDLLPTPNTMDDLPPKTREQIQKHRDEGRGGDRNLREYVLYDIPLSPAAENSPCVESRWGRYEAAIRRWEAVLGREAPEPTEPGKTAPRLSPRFTEWMMGLPEGWVCDTGISRKGMLHALGNGCVPAQVTLALHILLDA